MSSDPQKVIPGAEAGEVESWQLPEINDPSARRSGLLTAGQIEQIQKQAFEQAYREGHSKGYQEGRDEAAHEIKENVQYLQQLMAALAQPFRELDKEVENELMQLAMGMTRQLVRREIKLDPGQVIAVVREAIGSLPVAENSIKLYLNPEDAALVRDHILSQEEDSHWKVYDDPVITRGGCRVVTEHSQVDASVETRLAAIFARVIGGEREGDRQ
jgi:flagellar assembly protein FliH